MTAGIKVQLLNREMLVRGDTVDAIQDIILTHLAKTQAAEESVSHLVQVIRMKGWKFPTRMYDAECMFEALGFSFRRDKNSSGSVLRTFVTL